MQIKNIRLLNFGRVKAANETRTHTNESATGYFLHSDSIEFSNNQDTLNGEIGLSFGIEYYLEGFNATSKNQEAHFISRIIHPMLTNPGTNKGFTETIEKKYNYLNRTNFDYFLFEFDWEVRPGNWIFQVIEEDIILLEKKFIIGSY